LPHQALDYGATILTALFVSCGDDPDTCRRSVEQGWRLPAPSRDDSGPAASAH
jgi:hypothetical protein